MLFRSQAQSSQVQRSVYQSISVEQEIGIIGALFSILLRYLHVMMNNLKLQMLASRGSAMPRLRCMLSYGLDLRKKRTVYIFLLSPLIKYLMSHIAYMDFIFNRIKHRNPDGSLQIMYSIHGMSMSISRALSRYPKR